MISPSQFDAARGARGLTGVFEGLTLKPQTWVNYRIEHTDWGGIRMIPDR